MIGLVTYAKEPNLTEDDRPLIDDFASLGLTAAPVRWDDSRASWLAYDALLLRSCWDYHLRPTEFANWLTTVEALGVALVNPVNVVRWNMHKKYLRDLEADGVVIPETRWIERGRGERLSEIMKEAGWGAAIVKPAISASATDTWRVEARAVDDDRFAALGQRTDVLVQKFVPEVTEAGEWSLIFIDGEFSHAAFKRPKAGDFRVQIEHGGSAEPATAPGAVVASGAAIAEHIPRGWLYARIDGVVNNRGFTLMEVECIEPHLFFGDKPVSRRRLATAIARTIGQGNTR